ncbi:hypothetical protein DITRI_Ditri02bG0086800 [Diplodiscus trichospermus]
MVKLSIFRWTCNWVSTTPGFKLSRPSTANDENALVSSLINSTSNTWDLSKLCELFDRDTVNQICSIPLRRSFGPDVQVWHFTKSGIYTVKSAYHVLVSESINGSLNQSQEGNLFWNKMWSSDSPAKVKAFLSGECAMMRSL